MGPFFIRQTFIHKTRVNFAGESIVCLVMTVCPRIRKAFYCCALAGWLLPVGHVFAQNRSMNCHDSVPPTHAELTKGDQNSANHLDVNRKLGPQAAIVLDICDADVTIKGSNTDMLRVSVDIGSPAPKMTAGDYLQAIDITSQMANVKLHLPSQVRARVLIAVPSSTPKLDLNLVSGHLAFETDRISGERKINVVDGQIEVLANADSYGNFHDRHGGDSGGPALVSRSLTGTGKGSLEINLVKGSVDLKPWD
jgi:hypothetical protein